MQSVCCRNNQVCVYFRNNHVCRAQNVENNYNMYLLSFCNRNTVSDTLHWLDFDQTESHFITKVFNGLDSLSDIMQILMRILPKSHKSVILGSQSFRTLLVDRLQGVHTAKVLSSI